MLTSSLALQRRMIPITELYMRKKFGMGGAYINKIVAQLMRDLGPIPAPMNSYMLNLGLESLHVRMPRHCENAMAVAQFLEA